MVEAIAICNHLAFVSLACRSCPCKLSNEVIHTSISKDRKIRKLYEYNQTAHFDDLISIQSNICHVNLAIGMESLAFSLISMLL